MFSKQGVLKAPVFKTPLTVLKRGRFENTRFENTIDRFETERGRFENGGPVFKPYVFKTPKRFETPRFENASPVPDRTRPSLPISYSHMRALRKLEEGCLPYFLKVF